MRIIIAGSRTFNDYEYLKSEVLNIFKVLKNVYPETRKSNIEIISGCAKGADILGEKFAEEYNLTLKKFPANWRDLGIGAGYLRNKEMAEYAKKDNGVLIAFHVNQSRGTQHMINIAHNNRLKVFIIKVNSKENHEKYKN